MAFSKQGWTTEPNGKHSAGVFRNGPRKAGKHRGPMEDGKPRGNGLFNNKNQPKGKSK